MVVVTGGPGAGKTALLEMARRVSCEHVAVLPEAASIVFGGGFPRLGDERARRCSQRAIFHVQHELEELATTQADVALTLCDRGTLDGLAYWPGKPEQYWAELGTTREQQLARYHAVIHLQVPPREHGYAITGLRIESAEEAARIDDAIARAWEGHPRVERVESTPNFMDKIAAAALKLERLAPSCCTVTPPGGQR
jgi:predicted ATPase